MILSDGDIVQAIKSGELEIDPFSKDLINPNSYDLTLDGYGYSRPIYFDLESVLGTYPLSVDPFNKDSYGYEKLCGLDVYEIQPGEFLLGSVKERIYFKGNITGELTGKSSLARLGLMVHVTAGLGDAGWNGVYVLELYNVSRRAIELTDGMPIAQVVIQRTGVVLEPYGSRKKSKYQNQEAGTGSKYYLNER